MSPWESLIHIWSRTFFSEPFLMISMLAAFWTTLSFHKKERVRLFFIIYIITGFLLFISTDLALSFKIVTDRSYHIFMEIFNNVFETVELFTFLYFFSKVLNAVFIDRLFLILGLIFLLITWTFYFWIYQFSPPLSVIIDYSYHINVIEMFFLLMPCLMFFYKIFKDKPSIDLYKRPSFWIAVSLLFYCIIIIPFFMLNNTLFKTYPSFYFILVALHFITLSILYLSITKAFTCKHLLTI